MRQLCNVAFIALTKGVDADELDEWAAKLDAEPGTVPRKKTHLDPGLLGMLGQG